MWRDDDDVEVIEPPRRAPVPVVDLEAPDTEVELVQLSDEEENLSASSSSCCSSRCSGCQEENCSICEQFDI